MCPAGCDPVRGGSSTYARHSPSVVEARPLVWAALVLGACSWAQAVGAGTLNASGERSDLSGLLPLF